MEYISLNGIHDYERHVDLKQNFNNVDNTPPKI